MHVLQAAGDADFTAAVRAAEAKYASYTAYHTMAIRRAMAVQRGRSVAMRRSATARCELAERIVRETAKELRALSPEPIALDDVIRAGLAHSPICRSLKAQRELSVFTSPAVSGHAALNDLSYFSGQLSASVGTEPEPLATIVSRVDVILLQAYSVLSPADFEGLVAHAHFLITDLYEWQSALDSGEWVPSGGGDGSGPNEMSIFANAGATAAATALAAQSRGSRLRNIQISDQAKAVALMDLSGFVGGWLGGPKVAIALGAIASIAAM